MTMKKILLFTLLVFAASNTIGAATSKKKKKQKEVEPIERKLVTQQDSLSYATGLAATNGVLPFLQHEYDLDSTQTQAFIKAFKEAMQQIDKPEFKAQYAGASIARMVKNRILPQVSEVFKNTKEETNVNLFLQGFLDGVKNDTTIYTVEQAAHVYRKHAIAAKKAKEKAYKEENVAWLKANSVKPGVKTTASGLQYKIITAGTGEVPQKEDKVTVKYEGKTIDGNVFDSSYKRNPQTTSFRCDQVIKGWTEALAMMPVGSKWELYIPQELAYGDRQAGQIKPYSTLIFTVELVGIEKKLAEKDTTEQKTTDKKSTDKKKNKKK